MTENIKAAAVLLVSVCLTLLFNLFYLVVFFKRKRLRSYGTVATSALFALIAVIDMNATLLWTLLCAIAAFRGNWYPGDYLCELQVETRVFSTTANIFVFMLLMIERTLRIFVPAKHQEVCNKVNAILLCCTTIIVCTALSSMTSSVPSSYIRATYFQTEYQCSLTTDEAPAYYFSILGFTVIIPFAIILIGYIAIIIRVAYLRQKRSQEQFISLSRQKHKDANATYFFKFKNQYKPLKTLENKTKGRKHTKKDIDYEDCYTNTINDSSDDDFDTNNAPYPNGWFYLNINDMKLAHIYAAISVMYLGLWIPYFIYSYSYTLDTENYGDTFTLVAVCVSHFGGVIKIPICFISDNFRGAAIKTLAIK